MTTPAALSRPLRSPRRSRAVLLIGLTVATLQGACSDRPATGVVAVFSTDGSVPTEIDTVAIRATRGGVVRLDRTYTLGVDATLPGTLTFESTDDLPASVALEIVVTGRRAGGDVVARHARVPLVDEHVKLLRMPLSRACFGVPCTDDTTCVDGACITPDLDPATLPEFTTHDDAVARGGSSNGGTGGRAGATGAGSGGAPMGGAAGAGNGGQGGGGQGGAAGQGGASGKAGAAGQSGAGAAGAGAGGKAGAGQAGAAGAGAAGAGAGGAGVGGGGAGGTAGGTLCTPLEAQCVGNVLEVCDPPGGSKTRLTCTAPSVCDATNARCDSGNIVQLTWGDWSFCALDKLGEVSCWGANRNLLADGSKTQLITTPTKVTGVSGARRISAGGRHRCALMPDASIACWGVNDVFPLGTTNTPATGPHVVAPIELPAKVRDVAAIYDSTCALLEDGSVVCWGDNHDGMLCDGTNTASATPKKIPLAKDDARTLAGSDPGCVVHASGDASCWGLGLPGPTSLGLTDAVEVVNGKGGLIYVRRANGEVWVAQVTGATLSPLLKVPTAAQSKVSHVVAGVRMCMLLEDGSVHCGVHQYPPLDPPTMALGPGSAVEVVAGMSFEYGEANCARLATGKVSCWGSDGLGEIGVGKPDTLATPTLVKNVGAVTSVDLEYRRTAAVGENGLVTVWGSTGDLGNNANTDVPIPVAGETGQLRVRIGGDGQVAYLYAKTTNQAKYRGSAQHDLVTAAASYGSPLVDSVSAAGVDLGLLGDGRLIALTRVNDAGNTLLAKGTMTLAGEVDVVPSLSMVTAVSSFPRQFDSHQHACALSGGSLLCWGANGKGQLGIGFASFREAPLPPSWPSTAPTVDEVCTGTSFTCARHGGTVSCWGANDRGQLGDGTTSVAKMTPIPVGVSGMTGLACGGDSACAWDASGAALCWGSNEFGQLGIDSFAAVVAPKPMAGGVAVASMKMHARHACAIDTSKQLWCWGSNINGETGTGTSNSYPPGTIVQGL